MEFKDEERRPGTPAFIAKIFGIVMVVLYAGIGTTILFKIIDLSTIVQSNVPDSTSRIIGIMFILYGVFRGYKVYRRYY